MTQSHLHASHPGIATRLKRAEGHLRRVIGMIEEGRSCLDLATQLHAVERAIAEAKRALILDHIDHCLDDLTAPNAEGEQSPIEEFKLIAKYL